MRTLCVATLLPILSHAVRQHVACAQPPAYVYTAFMLMYACSMIAHTCWIETVCHGCTQKWCNMGRKGSCILDESGWQMVRKLAESMQ